MEADQSAQPKRDEDILADPLLGPLYTQAVTKAVLAEARAKADSEWDLTEFDPGLLESRSLGGDAEVPPLDATKRRVTTEATSSTERNDELHLNHKTYHAKSVPLGGADEATEVEQPATPSRRRLSWRAGAAIGLLLGAPFGGFIFDGEASLEEVERTKRGYVEDTVDARWLAESSEAAVEDINDELIAAEKTLNKLHAGLPEVCETLLDKYHYGGPRFDVAEGAAVGDILAEPGQPCGASKGNIRELLTESQQLTHNMELWEADLQDATSNLRRAQAVVEAGPQPSTSEKVAGVVLAANIGAAGGAMVVTGRRRITAKMRELLKRQSRNTIPMDNWGPL